MNDLPDVGLTLASAIVVEVVVLCAMSLLIGLPVLISYVIESFLCAAATVAVVPRPLLLPLPSNGLLCNC
jgi:hypothetical protein